MKSYAYSIAIILALMGARISFAQTWADSVLKSMTVEQKAAQVIMVRLHSNFDKTYTDTMPDFIARNGFGGVCVFQGGPGRQVNMLNRMQQKIALPALVAIDGEWGLSMRLDSTLRFPRQMALGAIGDDNLVRQMGQEIARQCRAVGVHINFAPCIDINNNLLNPVINSRSFGEDIDNVGRKGVAYALGLQDGGVWACAKHFPGHGDTDTDSHLALPTIKHTRDRLNNVELKPYHALINAGVKSVMIAHLMVPELDSSGTPSSLSKPIITDLLRKELGFDGLVFTDGLEMKAIWGNIPEETVAVKALMAGVDMLLLPPNPIVARQAICNAVANGELPIEVLDEHCLRVLKAKEELGLTSTPMPLNPDHLSDSLNTPQAEELNHTLIAQSLTLLRNNDSILPLNPDAKKRIALLELNASSSKGRVLYNDLKQRMPIDRFTVKCADLRKKSYKALMDTLATYDLVIAVPYGMNHLPAKNYGIDDQTKATIQDVSEAARTVLCLLGNAYALQYWADKIDNFASVVVAYQPSPEIEGLVAECMVGERPFMGHLPVSISEKITYGQGIYDQPEEIYYCLHPEKVGMNAEVLNKIDDIAIKGLKAEAYPGCQIVALRNGEKVYEKAFGTYTYNDSVYVTNASVYDLASLTKSLATTLAVMKLYDEGKLSLTDHASKYVHELKHTNKSKITIAQLLTHTSGLPAWIPFYKSTLKNGMPDPDIYDTLPSGHYPEQVAEHLYIHKNYGEKMLKEIAHAKLNPSQGYVYSDLGFYILKEIVEHISKTTLDEYVRTAFYEPMQLHSTGFCPLRRLDTGLVVPTENDTYFRHQLLRGHVHDMGAAMMGGVSGHAGLFSTASEAAELIQMLLNKGTYNGKTYLKPETVTLFTNYYQSNRRGLGFDKPYANKKSGHVCHQAGKNSFGHSGYTGTYFWADFDTGIVYVFLSNRVHPTAENTKLAKLNIRTDIHELLYKAIIK